MLCIQSDILLAIGANLFRSRSTLGVKNIVNQLESADGTEEIWKFLDDAAEVLSCCAGTYWLSLLDALQRVECRELLVEVLYWKRKLVYRSNDLREYAKLIIFAGRLSYRDFGHEILNYMCAKGLKRKATIYNSLIDAQRKDKTIAGLSADFGWQGLLLTGSY